MSAVARFINNIIRIPIISQILEIVGKWLDTELEFVMGLFGIKDEDVISTEVATQRIMNDIDVTNLWTKAALEKMKDDSVGILELVMSYADVSRKSYSEWYHKGKTEFVDGLPTANVHAQAINKAVVKSVVDSVHGINSSIVSVKLGSTNKEAWSAYVLHDLYGYSTATNLYTYNGHQYALNSVDYNYTTNKYDVVGYCYETVTTTVVTTTEVTITVGSTTDSRRTLVTRTTTSVGSLRGTLSSSTVTVSDVTDTVTKDSVVGGVSSVTDSTTSVQEVAYTHSFSIDAYDAVRYYTVVYSVGGVDNYWVYKLGAGTYPTLDAMAGSYVTNLEMLPIVAIRKNLVNVNSSKTSARYLTSKKLLDALSIDIDDLTDSVCRNSNVSDVLDVFVHFGLRPQDTSAVMSKALYSMFEYIYGDSTLMTGGSYTATFTEDTYNCAVKWSAQSMSSVVGTIGTVGTYKHTVDGDTLTLKKQVTTTRYSQIVIDGVSALTIIRRDGLSGVKELFMTDASFAIPISYYFINKLNKIEQYELFAKTLLISEYAAHVTHLEWYQTAGFSMVLKVVAVVLSIFTFGGSLLLLAIAFAASYALTWLLKYVLKHTHNKFLQALAMAVYVVAMVYGASFCGFTDAGALTNMVTMFSTTASAIGSAINIYTGVQMEELNANKSTYETNLNNAFDAIDTANDTYFSDFTTADVLQVEQYKPVSAYVEGYDLMFYRAVQAQYNFDSLFDYDRVKGDYYAKAFDVGIV